MEVIKSKKGLKYRERIYINGKEYKSPCLETIDEAKLWKAQKVSERKKLEYCGFMEVPYKPQMLLKDFAQKWFEEKIMVRNAKRTQDDYKFTLKSHILPVLGNIPIGRITYEHANLLIKKVKEKGLSNRTINKCLIRLKSMMIEAVRWNYLPKNPLFEFPELKEDLRGDVYWTVDEISQFLRVNFSSPLYPLYVTALNTGLRKGELLGLCWDRINFAINQIEITRTMTRYGLNESTKTNRKRVIPMNFEVKKVLMELHKKKLNPKLVFTKPDGEALQYAHIAQRDFKNDQKKAGLTNIIRFHDLRHTFASQYMMHGGDIYVLKTILGHSEIEMTNRYAHLSSKYLEEAMNIISFSGEEKKNVLLFRTKSQK